MCIRDSYYGAHVTLVDGLISDCARKVAELKEKPAWSKQGWFDVSTTKEPYRVEGKKTMGYEVAEQLGWKLPQGIIYPTGSFKARGLSAAVTMARHFGLKKLAIPSAGNAAGALAAYAAAAHLEAHIFMPKDVPMANRIECHYYGCLLYTSRCV